MSEPRTWSDDRSEIGAPDEGLVAAGLADMKAAAALVRDAALGLAEGDPTRPFDASWDDEEPAR